jgi:hypothetical protein
VRKRNRTHFLLILRIQRILKDPNESRQIQKDSRDPEGFKGSRRIQEIRRIQRAHKDLKGPEVFKGSRRTQRIQTDPEGLKGSKRIQNDPKTDPIFSTNYFHVR